jgi:hypothetical protein
MRQREERKRGKFKSFKVFLDLSVVSQLSVIYRQLMDNCDTTFSQMGEVL